MTPPSESTGFITPFESMPLFVIGISHRTAPLEVRERLAFDQADVGELLASLCTETAAREAVVVSTCNRTELYVVTDRDDPTPVQGWLARQGGFDDAPDPGLFYCHQDQEAIRHLYRVACGLESLVLGEPQIIGQLKNAWSAAVDAGTTGKITHRLFQRAFSASKAVRSTTGINDHPVSVAYIATILAQQIFGDLERQTVLMIGAGEMVELCARHLRQQGVNRLMIANRSLDRAQELARSFGAEALPLDELDARLHEADIVISSTASRSPIIQQDAVRSAIHQRRHRPAFLVDLGVPRDIDATVAELRDVYLYTIDDLQQVADENLAQRRRAAEHAGDSVEGSVGDFLRWLHGNRAAMNIARLRADAEESADALAERALNRMKNGADAEEAVRQLATTVVHKILHGPSVRLREAAEQDRFEVLRAADWLFEDHDDDPEPSA